MKLILVLGMCLRLINSDPWQEPTYKVLRLGKHSILTEKAIDHSGGWSFSGSTVFTLKEVKQYPLEEVKCPDIRWEKNE